VRYTYINVEFCIFGGMRPVTCISCCLNICSVSCFTMYRIVLTGR